MLLIINSLLDQDLYKLTMQQCVLFGGYGSVRYQDVDVEYQFINRGGTKFPPKFDELLSEHLLALASLRLHEREHRWLSNHCPYLKRAYLHFLRGYQLRVEQVAITQKGGDLTVRINGPWYETIYFEVMLMAMISELYFRSVGCRAEQVVQRAKEKADLIREHGLIVADFGTRRRFSAEVHDVVVRTLVEHAGSTFVGTSNVYLAMKYGIKPIGTHAHEFFMANAALFGYNMANEISLNAWVNEFQGNLGIALTDTFTSKVFFEQFDMKLAKLFDGVRHDSGDPIVFAQRAVEHYKKLGIDPLSKWIVFSDGLTIKRAIEIRDWCAGKIKCSFGIGTFLTNDCGNFSPLNMVIKLTSVLYNGRVVPAVKLSDVSGKHTGDPAAVQLCKAVLGETNA